MTTKIYTHGISHSPGPWRRDGTENDVMQSAIIRDATGFQIATVSSWLVDQYEANANAIAAVPDLLESLVDSIRLIEHLGGNAKNQKKALAKACHGSDLRS